ncbi:sensor histidine kinase [Bacillus sp. FJAT-29790]|uniref:ATP-binding protein n=1 Tax=Bacillus sp. FJAT-29790 TaxID=1895002 RepID=UPI001C234939|nr:sensor histidine kinase [Bacillus sp. FJAT-29790]MBU8881336.1 sensor histidine kinase [Bacillus sp. FJAT-29790]
MINFQKSDIKNPHIKPNVTINLKMKMILLIGILIIAIVAVIGLFVDYFISDSLETQMGDRALGVANSVARIPELAKAFTDEDPASIIDPIIAPIKETTGAEFIVVGNMEEIRYSHPMADHIGKKMVGGDNVRALVYGESYVSKAEGSLGSSLRAKVPVYLEGKIVGVVSVGFLAADIQSLIRNYKNQLWFVLLFIAGVAIIGAVVIASYIKKVLFGMEPEEIAHLLFQKETILKSAHEGIIALNQYGIITTMNAAAQQLLFNEETSPENYLGKTIQEVSLTTDLAEYLNNINGQSNKEMMIGNQIVFVNSVPIYFEHTFIGTVSTLRNKAEIELLSKELARVKQYANALRAQTHEFSNKLYTILGLLQLGKREEVIDYIQKESNLQKNWIRLLIQKVSDPLVSGLLLGKLNQANELGIDLSIDSDSVLESQLCEKQSKALLTAVGNLIDNAVDAVKNRSALNRKISIFFTDIGNDIIFEIEDSGEGIPEEISNKIFEQGFSLKEGVHRGFGLALTKQLISEVNGALYLEEGELNGACFVVSIPKEETQKCVK